MNTLKKFTLTAIILISLFNTSNAQTATKKDSLIIQKNGGIIL